MSQVRQGRRSAANSRLHGASLLSLMCFSCIPPATPSAVLAGMVFLIFSILGVQLFAGLLWSCNDDSVAGKVRTRGVWQSLRIAAWACLQLVCHQQFPC